jgi:hypothetical protein
LAYHLPGSSELSGRSVRSLFEMFIAQGAAGSVMPQLSLGWQRQRDPSRVTVYVGCVR